MAVFALIADGKIINVVMYDAGAETPEGAIDVTSASPQPAIGWAYDGKTFAPPAIDVPLDALAAALVAAASAACDAITRQVIPDATHAQAYQNAAMIVWGSGGAAPSADPAKSIFAAQGASVGLSDPEAFAKVVEAVSLGSMQLATILATLKGAAASAKTAADLKAALSAFETALNTFVGGLNAAGLTISVTAPPAIAIPGLNA